MLARLLGAGQVLTHPFVIGELALGAMRQRETVLDALSNLLRAKLATDVEVLNFINRQSLFARGIGTIDVHLLASVRLTAGAALWTLDKRLQSVADEFGLAMTS